MIIDNENQKLKVYEWITKYNEAGTLDVVTGYFTIGALAFLSKSTNDKFDKYRFVLGDIVNFDDNVKALDLLNERIDIDTAFRLNKLAKEAVAFLELEKVNLKTLEPNFCHAKLYLKTATDDDRNHYFISGSSNLTEAGIGQKTTSNVELNIAETGNNNQYKELLDWFNDLWIRKEAHTEKTLTDENGKKYPKSFKQYLIEEISKLFEVYTPEQIYYKILFELFHKDQDNPEVEKQLTKLEDTIIFNKLYDFQKGGVRSLIRMLNKYNGAILADAVGLGKTWSALAVMKSFQKDHQIILLSPKKLEQNWNQYYYKNNSLFQDDNLDFELRFHTDLREGGFDRDKVKLDYFVNDKKKLIVIDESHNLRNDKSSRYKFLVEEILKKSKGEIKVLLLSATPINNSFKDIRNQFKLMTKGENSGFKEALDVNNIESTFREIQTVFNKWSKESDAKLSDFHSKIKDSAFFRLTDQLLVARTRKNVKANFDKTLSFPTHKKPINIFKTPIQFGDVENFAELMDNLDLNLSAYLPVTYTFSKAEREQMAKDKAERQAKKEKAKKDEVLKDDVQREHFLVKMMLILMLKRLESSWFSFDITVNRIYEHHRKALDKINAYQKLKTDAIFMNEDTMDEDLTNDDDTGIVEHFLFGKKNPISLSAIDAVGSLNEFKEAIKKDKKSLKYILDNISEFKEKFQPEKKLTSVDVKLAELLKIIIEKQKTSNPKIVIFSAYKDTVEYIFDQLKLRGFDKFAMVSGDGNKVWNEYHFSKKHDTILERFAPFTKLFKEKNWNEYDKNISYEDWKQNIQTDYPKDYEKLINPIDILITTDVLSEGQNLQDADMVINYDIHWNPVRVIQRVGRIDRIGSPNDEIQTINFWPAKDIDTYINLKERVEKRMAIMKVSGSEVIDEFTDDFNELAEANKLEDQQNANMLRQMESTMEDIDGEQTLGFDDFSFDNYRQLLQNMLNQKKKEFENMPNGVFSGIKIEHNPEMQPGIISLLGYPAQKKYKPNTSYLSYELIYIDLEGNQVSNNQKIILEQLNKYHTLPTSIDPKVKSGDAEAVNKLSNALKTWISNQAKTEIEMEDGTKKVVMSNAGLDLINKFKKNPKEAVKLIDSEGSISEKYKYDNFDLITWLIIS